VDNRKNIPCNRRKDSKRAENNYKLQKGQE
jgi:hypothetical protein